MYFILYFYPSLNPLACFFVHELCIHGSYYVEERAYVTGHIPSFSCCWTKSLQTKPSVQIIKLRHFRQNNSGTDKRLHSSKIIFITSLLCHSKMFSEHITNNSSIFVKQPYHHFISSLSTFSYSVTCEYKQSCGFLKLMYFSPQQCAVVVTRFPSARRVLC